VSSDRRSRDVDVLEAVELLRQDGVLLDVREPEETVVGHAPEALTIPLGELQQRIHELKDAEPIVVICRTGSRSALVADALVGAGFNAVNLEGGMHAWQAAGFPVVDDSGGAGFVA
jgi:rhodanese-related sulfurtransferase